VPVKSIQLADVGGKANQLFFIFPKTYKISYADRVSGTVGSR
jgi:hypothetical protein